MSVICILIVTSYMISKNTTHTNQVTDKRIIYRSISTSYDDYVVRLLVGIWCESSIKPHGKEYMYRRLSPLIHNQIQSKVDSSTKTRANPSLLRQHA